MFSNRKITTSTKDCSDEVKRLRELLQKADAVIIGAGAGLSTSAGFTYTGQRFEDNFSDFIKKYGFRDMYSGGFYPFESLEEHWAYWSRYEAIKAFTEKRANMAIGYVKDCSAAEIRFLRHELYNGTLRD